MDTHTRKELCTCVQDTICSFMKENCLSNDGLAELILEKINTKDESTKTSLLRCIRDWKKGAHLPTRFYTEKLSAVFKDNGDNARAEKLERIEEKRLENKTIKDRQRKARYRERIKTELTETLAEQAEPPRKITDIPPFLSDEDLEGINKLLPTQEELLALNGPTEDPNKEKSNSVAENYIARTKAYGIKRDFWKGLGEEAVGSIKDLPIDIFVELFRIYSWKNAGVYDELHESPRGLILVYAMAKYLWDNTKESPIISEDERSVYAGLAIVNEPYELGAVWDFSTTAPEGTGAQPYICEGMNEFDDRFDIGIYGRACRAFTTDIKVFPADEYENMYYIYAIEDEDALAASMEWFEENMPALFIKEPEELLY